MIDGSTAPPPAHGTDVHVPDTRSVMQRLGVTDDELRTCAICGDPDDHNGAAHSDATGDDMGRYGKRLPGGGFPGRRNQ